MGLRSTREKESGGITEVLEGSGWWVVRVQGVILPTLKLLSFSTVCASLLSGLYTAFGDNPSERRGACATKRLHLRCTWAFGDVTTLADDTHVYKKYIPRERFTVLLLLSLHACLTRSV